MIKIIVFIFLILSIIIFGVDFYFYMLNRYCRYHIGRWNNYDEWLSNVKNISIKWTRKTPVVKMTDNNRLMVIDMINGKYKNNNIQSWQLGGLLLGLCECNDKEAKEAINKLIIKLIDKDGNWVTKPTNVDCGLLSYAILKNSKDYKKIKPAMDYSIGIIEKNICAPSGEDIVTAKDAKVVQTETTEFDLVVS